MLFPEYTALPLVKMLSLPLTWSSSQARHFMTDTCEECRAVTWQNGPQFECDCFLMIKSRQCISARNIAEIMVSYS